MKRIMVILVVVAVSFTGVQLANAEEELFDSTTATVYLEKGIAHLKSKNYDAAIAELEESVSINPDAEAFYYLGYAYYLKGKTGDGESRKKSIESFEKAYELNPNFTPSRYKPAETVAPRPEEKKSEAHEPADSSKQEQESGQASQPDQPVSQDMKEKTSDSDVPPQPATPFKATERVNDIGNTGN